MSGGGWSLLRAPLRDTRGALWRVAWWSSVESLPVVLSGHLIARALDLGFLDGRFAFGVLWLLGFAAAMLLRAYAGRQVVPWTAEVVETTRDALARNIVAGALRRAAAAPETVDTAGVARVSRQTEGVREILNGLLGQLRGVVFSVGGAVVGLVTLAPRLAFVVLPALLAALGGLVLLLRALAERERALLLAEEQASKSSGTTFAAVRDIAACGAEERAGREAGADLEAHRDAARALARIGVWRPVVVGVGARLPLVVALLLAPWMVQQGALSTGEVVGVATYLLSGLEPAMRSLVEALGQLGLQLHVVLGRLWEWRDVPAPPAVGTQRPERAALELEGVTFAYGPHAEPVFRDLSLSLPEGAHLAVVGPSGIGKSTLASVLTRIVEPQAGEVRIGGVRIGDVDERWLRQRVALLPQESYVFAGTLRENVAYLRPDADDADLDAAAEAVGAAGLVRRLGGWNAVIEHPSSLSAGERQWAALARAFVSPARVVILDEATCHLDPSAERVAEEAFIRRGGTLVVIAHRISSALRAPEVLVLEGASHVIGGHADLPERSPLYADLIGHWESVH